MNIEHIRNHLAQIESGDFQPNDAFQWRKTLSGMIFTNVETIALKLKKTAAIQNAGGPYEIFSLGDEKTTLTKRLIDSTAGENGGTIETYAECWDYKNYPWWKEALYLKGYQELPVTLLDTPVIKLAYDAQILNPENLFDPAVVVNDYGLNPTGENDQQFAAEQWVKDQIQDILNPLLKPGYKIEEYENRLRLRPQNDEARQSRFENNQVYEAAKTAISKSVVQLEERYKRLQRSFEG